MIANVIFILYNSSANKKLISSELHFRHNIVCFVFCFADENSSNQSRSRACVHLRATLWCFFFFMNLFLNESLESMIQ